MKNCCTYWFKGWWNACCCQHDKNYYKSGLSRRESDDRLFDCVYTSLGDNLFGKIISFPVAVVMWVGVRLGGRSRYERKQGGVKNGT